MKIEINGIPKEKKIGIIQVKITELLDLFDSYKYIYEESKGK